MNGSCYHDNRISMLGDMDDFTDALMYTKTREFIWSVKM